MIWETGVLKEFLTSKQIKDVRFNKVHGTSHQTISQLISVLESTLLKPENEKCNGTEGEKLRDHLGSLQNQEPIGQIRAHFSKDQTAAEVNLLCQNHRGMKAGDPWFCPVGISRASLDICYALLS